MERKGLWAKAVALVAAAWLALTMGMVTVSGARAAEPVGSANSGMTVPVAADSDTASDEARPTVTIGNTQVDAAFGITTPQELEALLLSDTPADVVLDGQSGEIVAIYADEIDEFSASTVGVACSTKSVCLHGGWNIGFNASGTHTGRWRSIRSWSTGKWTAQIRWESNGTSHLGAKVGPEKWQTIAGGASVVVTMVRMW